MEWHFGHSCKERELQYMNGIKHSSDLRSASYSVVCCVNSMWFPAQLQFSFMLSSCNDRKALHLSTLIAVNRKEKHAIRSKARVMCTFTDVVDCWHYNGKTEKAIKKEIDNIFISTDSCWGSIATYPYVICVPH